MISCTCETSVVSMRARLAPARAQLAAPPDAAVDSSVVVCAPLALGGGSAPRLISCNLSALA
jgi:hypothetical protein